jgi:hypothetical protein
VSEPTPFDALVTQIIEGQAPSNVRAAAARGALPLPRATLVRLFILLLEDEEETIRQSAGESLNGLGAEAIQEVLADVSCEPAVLMHFAGQAVRKEAMAELIAFHPAVPAGALDILASAGGASVIDLVLTNQERLLVQPGLLEKLMVNPALRADQRGRILELLDRAMKLQEAAKRKSADAAGEAAAGDEPEDLEEAAQLLDVDVGELLFSSEIMGGEEFLESEDSDLRGAYQKIITLNAAQKAILAMKGGREERLILIRDTNKVVALAVLRNGRLTDNEVESIAKMRNVCDEVLRQVGSNRDWIKSYAIIMALLGNPRTPPSIATNFVGRLQNKDLKNLAANRDVPDLIRKMAKRTHATRTQPQTRPFKKK